MNRSTLALMFPLMLSGTLVFADDTMSRATPTDQQLIKTCIEKQKADEKQKTDNVTMSKAEMKRYCKDQLKRQKATGSLPEAPPTDLQRPPTDPPQ
jgi:hypothetical protein